MAVTPTTNKFLNQVTVGTEVGTWGPYINANANLTDSFLGGLTTIALINTPVTLSSAQYANTFIRFTGTITANIAITFPAVGSFYTIINDCINSSNFNLTATTTAAGGRVVGLPPNTMTQIMTDGTNCRFSTLPPIGTLWDIAGSSTPSWVSACTVPPYLYCNGAAFSSATYPGLTVVMGGTTLPDLRGRYRGTLNDGTGRITGAVDGNNNLNTGGGTAITIGQTNLPNYNLTVNDPGHTHGVPAGTSNFLYKRAAAGFQLGSGTGNINVDQTQTVTGSATTGITVGSGGGGNALDAPLPPTQIVGITLVRAG